MNRAILFRSTVIAAYVSSILLGILVLIGWHTGLQVLTRILPVFAPMQYNTALGFVMAGLFLLLVDYERYNIAALPGTIVFLIGLLTLGEYTTGVSLGLEEALMKRGITIETSHPGRMAPITALCFFISAIAGRLSIGNLSGRRLSGIFGFLVIGMGVVALFGSLFHVDEVFGWGRLTRMAIHTSIGFIILGAGLTAQSRLQEHKYITAEMPGLNSWLIGYALSLAVIIFLIDINLPLGIAMGVPYIVLLLMAFYIQNRRSVIILAVVSTILTLLGYYLSPQISDTNFNAIANRTFAISAIWVVAFLIDNVKEKSRKLASMNRALDKQVAHRTRQLKARNKELEQFVYIASHDLKEPLNTVASFTNHLQQNYSEKIDAKGKKSMRFIEEATQRMSTLIKDLLDYSRIGRDVKFTEVDCNHLLEEVRSDLTTRLEISHSMIHIGNLPVVTGHATELRLLFQNLITNAIKFKKTDEDMNIHIGSKSMMNEWEFFVEDNGIGIAEKHKEKIFNIFQRIHTRSQYKGTGIGLAHCKKIVELHDGRIWVESQLGEGSTFFFTIPK